MLRSAMGAAVLLGALSLGACEGTDVTRVVDAENVIVKGHKIRLFGVDAPDAANPKCEMEQRAGELAEERLQALFLAAKEISFRKAGMACLQFMNCDGFVMVDGVDVGETLIAENLVARKHETVQNWCALKPLPAPEAIDLAPVVPPTTPN